MKNCIKKYSLLLISFLGWICPSIAVAEKTRILTPDNGLSNSHITQIYQDSKGYIWIATENGLNKFDGYSFTVYSERENDSTSLKGNYVYAVLEDSHGNFWVGTMSGLYRYDRNTDSFHPFRIESETPFYMDRVVWILEDKKGNIWLSYPGNGIIRMDSKDLKPTFYNYNNSRIADNNIHCAYEDAYGKLWLGTYGNGIYVLDPENQSVSHYINSPSDLSGLNNPTAFSICEDPQGRILAGTLGGGVNVFDRSTQTFKQVMTGNSQTKNQIYSICIDKSGNFWLGTDGAGVIRYDGKGNKLPELDYVSDACDLSKAKIHQIFEDKQGNIWIALYQKGILFIPATGKTFRNYGFNPFHSSQSIGMNCVISVLEDSYGDVWLGTDGDGMYRINHSNQSISHFSTSTQPQIPGNVITALFEDKDQNIWFGTYVNGMFRYNRQTAQFDSFYPNEHVTTFVQDKNGTLWIGMNGGGICRLDTDKKIAKQYMYKSSQDWNNQLASNWVYDMLIDATGKIWIGTSNGVSLFEPSKEIFTHFPISETLQNTNLIYTLISDHAGNIWIGSFFGLYRIDAQTKEIRHLTTSDGLPDNMINGIEEDENHFLWLSTGKGLCRYNPETGSILNLYAEDGIQSNEFRRGSHFKGKNGQMYFGGINGLTTFYPSDLAYKNTLLRLAFSELRIYNSPVTVGQSDVLSKTLDESESIRLKYNQRDFTFTFAALEYGMPQRVQYYTQMENFNTQWRLANMPDRSVTYTNLNPGKYVFKVKATLDGIHFLERQIQVIIDPPFWLSIWAKIIYILLALALLYTIYAYLSYRMKQNRMLLEKEQQKELSESKLQFFTDVSHEIRTPLSLIISPIEKLMTDKKNEKNLPIYKIIYQNAIRILRLINQLMDLRAVENGKLKLHLEKTSLEEFIRKIMDSFNELAKTKQIDFELVVERNLPMIYIDKDCLDKIIFNLLSNAFKFTPQNGRTTVYLGTHGEEAEIRVEDTGCGIEKEKQTLIFDRFYQVPDSKTNTRMGTGIGLHLAKMMIELHQGSIGIESELNQGSTFIVRLPLDKRVYSPENFGVESGESPVTMLQPSVGAWDTEKNFTGSKEDTKKDKRLHSILIVEDDTAIQNYIRTEFSAKYTIYSANNGKEGLNQALKFLPDVVISDILMPEMNGLALCRMLKTNDKTSHIPVILLTAKTSIEQRIEGLETGADSYIPKPFNLKHLETRINKLIQLRTTLEAKYGGKQEEIQNDLNVISSDERLLRKLNEKLKEQIGNPNLSVASISKELGLSRIHLNRRLKSIIKESPGVYIRNYRLKQAALLLSKKKASIAEIAYAVGFSSHAHFSSLFKEYYGVSPTEYMEANFHPDKSVDYPG
jgi:signal transduction histidine kinase/ligand-binding sensor domain-containing protein/DNA-binding response OmpR family regulator